VLSFFFFPPNFLLAHTGTLFRERVDFALNIPLFFLARPLIFLIVLASNGFLSLYAPLVSAPGSASFCEELYGNRRKPRFLTIFPPFARTLSSLVAVIILPVLLVSTPGP